MPMSTQSRPDNNKKQPQDQTVESKQDNLPSTHSIAHPPDQREPIKSHSMAYTSSNLPAAENSFHQSPSKELRKNTPHNTHRQEPASQLHKNASSAGNSRQTASEIIEGENITFPFGLLKSPHP
jgi:hypothetical protein